MNSGFAAPLGRLLARLVAYAPRPRRIDALSGCAVYGAMVIAAGQGNCAERVPTTLLNNVPWLGFLESCGGSIK